MDNKRHVHVRLSQGEFDRLKNSVRDDSMSIQSTYEMLTSLYLDGKLNRIINGEYVKRGLLDKD